MLKKSRKLIIISLLILVFASFSLLFSSSNPCGCADTYEGQHLTAYKCKIVGGEVISRTCYYGGAEKL